MQSGHQLVIDTSVWISGLVFGGNPERLIHLYIDGTIVVVTSEELLSELRRKISVKFPLYLPQLQLLEGSIREDALLVKLGLASVTVSRDPADNAVIETALAGHAHYIVTGDKDLLVLKHYEGIQIFKPAEFLRLIDS